MTDETGHILVVDDNRMNRQKLQISLENQGHQVGTAENGWQALELLQSAAYDVVLLDILMPELDGFQVLERMKGDASLRDIPVIVISAVEEIDSVVRCIEMGAEDYLQKPFNPVVLRARLNSSLQRKKLRDLEKAYLQQEVMLRQSEKLATLGRLSAGVAHELNNPAAAARRGASQLWAAFAHLQEAQLLLSALEVERGQMESLRSLENLAQERAGSPPRFDPLQRSANEEKMESWLEGLKIENTWEVAPVLVSLGFNPDELRTIAEGFRPGQFPAIVHWLQHTAEIYSLLNEITQGTARISEIVNGLKAYTYLDQAPIKMVDLNAGLENTLSILGDRLTPWIGVSREFSPDLPHIQAYGSELNQVWTNLINNALDALKGAGEIALRTCQENGWACVEVEDSGTGIPLEILGKIFDPFFTTKPVGAGTGLGLSICHHIIVQKHKGRIEVASQPGKTVFKVFLPLRAGV